MNLERLEMMRVMMERVAAGSWEPVEFQGQNDLSGRGVGGEFKGFVVKSLDLSSWACEIREPAKNICGFSACAVGHACFDEEFRKLGWSWVRNMPEFDGKSDWEAVDAFFDFKECYTANHLFSSSHYTKRERAAYEHLPTKTREAKMVADRIQELMTIGESHFAPRYSGRNY